MRTQSIENYENRKINPLAAGVMGGITGYAAKYALPFSEYEKGFVQNENANSIVKNAERNARKAEFKTIAKDIVEQKIGLDKPATDVFIKSKNAILDNDFKLNDFDKNIQKSLSELIKRIDERGIAEKDYTEKMFKSIAKTNRSAFYFVAVGAATLMCIASLGNGLVNTKNQK